MRILIKNIKHYGGERFSEYAEEGEGYKTLACCCGHGRYPMTIIVQDILEEEIRDWCSDIVIPRKRKFYKKDKHGYYYIKECMK